MAFRIFPNQEYSAPYAAAYIYLTGESKPIPLWFKGTTVKPERISLTATTGSQTDGNTDFDALSYVTSISLEIGKGLIPTISITLDPPYEAGQRLIDSPLVKFGNGTLAVQFGYSSGSGTTQSASKSALYTCMMDVPDVNFGTDCSITLKGKSDGGFKAASTQISQTLPRGKRGALIGQLLQSSGLTLSSECEALLQQYITANTYGMKTLLEEEVAYTTAGKDLLEQLELAAKEAGCILLLRNNTAILLPHKAIYEQKPVMGLQLRGRAYSGSSNFNANDPLYFPILSVSTDNKAIFMPTTIRTRVQQGKNPLTGEDIKVEAKPTDAASPSPQSGTADIENGTENATNTGETPSSPSAAQILADTFGAAAGDTSGIKLQVETIGIPEVFPAQNVQVRGVSRLLDKIYNIEKVTHNYSNSGYTTSLELLESATQQVAEALAKPAPVSGGAIQAAPNAAADASTGSTTQTDVQALANKSFGETLGKSNFKVGENVDSATLQKAIDLGFNPKNFAGTESSPTVWNKANFENYIGVQEAGNQRLLALAKSGKRYVRELRFEGGDLYSTLDGTKWDRVK